MYKVTVVSVNEEVEVEVDTMYCIVDDKNNLILVNKLDEMAKPIGMFPAGRWVAALKE